MCRSPIAEAFARRLRTKHSLPVEVHSAGVMDKGIAATKQVLRALARRGIDASGHRSSLLADALELDPDLIVAMAGEHVRAVRELDGLAADRTFLLKRLVLLAETEGPRPDGEPLRTYLAKLKASDTVGLRTFAAADEIQDPIGHSLRFLERTTDQIEELIRRSFAQLWPQTHSTETNTD